MAEITKAEIKDAAGKGWRVISRSDTYTHVELLANGWAVKVQRDYYRRPIRVAWSPNYSLISPDGQSIVAGYKSAGGFVDQAIRSLKRRAV